MTQDKVLPICERLLKVDSDPIGAGLAHNWHRNPDGPEAADIIERLYGALNGLVRKQGVCPASEECSECIEALATLRAVEEQPHG